MAKIVSTKFGDRRLVHLPPVNMSGTRTAQVDTLAPPSDAAEYRQRYGLLITSFSIFTCLLVALRFRKGQRDEINVTNTHGLLACVRCTARALNKNHQ